MLAVFKDVSGLASKRWGSKILVLDVKYFNKVPPEGLS